MPPQNGRVRHRRRKLSNADELEVTRFYSLTPMPVGEIANRFNVAESSVYRIAVRHGALLRRSDPNYRKIDPEFNKSATILPEVQPATTSHFDALAHMFEGMFAEHRQLRAQLEQAHAPSRGWDVVVNLYEYLQADPEQRRPDTLRNRAEKLENGMVVLRYLGEFFARAIGDDVMRELDDLRSYVRAIEGARQNLQRVNEQ